MKLRTALVALCPAVCLLCPTAQAAFQGSISSAGPDPTLPLNNVWQGPYDEILPGGNGSFFNETWTFSGPAILQITDLYVPGDYYNIYDNNVLIGSTAVLDWSAYETDPWASPPYTTDPAAAWMDSHFAHFQDTLGAGDHSITIQSYLPSGFDDGTYSIEACPVPEPTTFISAALLLLPFGMSTLRMLRKRQAA